MGILPAADFNRVKNGKSAVYRHTLKAVLSVAAVAVASLVEEMGQLSPSEGRRLLELKGYGVFGGRNGHVPGRPVVGKWPYQLFSLKWKGPVFVSALNMSLHRR